MLYNNKIKKKLNIFTSNNFFFTQVKPKPSEETALVVRETTAITIYSKKFVQDCKLLELKHNININNDIKTPLITEKHKTDENKLELVKTTKLLNNGENDVNTSNLKTKNDSTKEKFSDKINLNINVDDNKDNKKTRSGLNFDFVYFFLRKTGMWVIKLYLVCCKESPRFVQFVNIFKLIMWFLRIILTGFNLFAAFLLILASNLSYTRNWNMTNKKLYKRVRFLNNIKFLLYIFIDKDAVDWQIAKLSSRLGYSEQCRLDHLFIFFDDVARWTVSQTIINISPMITELTGKPKDVVYWKLRESEFWRFIDEVAILLSRILLIIRLSWIRILLVWAFYYLYYKITIPSVLLYLACIFV
jgi:hypothetical protein